VGAASPLMGKPAAEVMEAFGEALVPGLLKVYGRMVKKGWRTLEVLEHTESAIHTVVRRQTPGAAHFRDEIELQEPQCMLKGDRQCRISVRLSGSGAL